MERKELRALFGVSPGIVCASRRNTGNRILYHLCSIKDRMSAVMFMLLGVLSLFVMSYSLYIPS